MKQRLAAPSDVIDLAGIEGCRASRPTAAALTIGADHPRRRRGLGRAVHKDDPGARPPRRPYRRPACPQPRHDRRLGRQQRSGGRLPGRPAGAQGHRRHRPARDRGRQLLHRHVRDRAADDEIITAVPSRPEMPATKFPNPASRYAMTGVFVAETAGDVRVAVTGAGGCPPTTASATCTPPPTTAPTWSTSWPNAPWPRRVSGHPSRRAQ
jgi:aerobic carbon-monoxide dehydrogenase medium subunit